MMLTLTHVGFKKGDTIPCYWVLTRSVLSLYSSKESYNDMKPPINSFMLEEIETVTIEKLTPSINVLIVKDKDETVELLGSESLLNNWINQINILMTQAQLTKSSKVINQNENSYEYFPNLINYSYMVFISFSSIQLEEISSYYLLCFNPTQKFKVEVSPSGVKKDKKIIFPIEKTCYILLSSYLFITLIKKISTKKEEKIAEAIIHLSSIPKNVVYLSQIKLEQNSMEIGELQFSVDIKKNLVNVIESPDILQHKITKQDYCYNAGRKSYYILHKEITKNKEEFKGIISGIGKIEHVPFNLDLEDYFMKEKVTTESFENIPLSGTITQQYPKDERLLDELWMFCFPNGMKASQCKRPFEKRIFEITNSKGKERYGFAFIIDRKINANEIKEINKWIEITDEWYIPEAIFIVSEEQLFEEMNDWLQSIIENTESREEQFAQLYITPQIKYGEHKEIKINEKKMIIEKEYKGDIKETELELSELFYHFRISEIIDIWSEIILCERIIFTCKNYNTLVKTIEMFKILLFPLEWVCISIALLPRILINQLTSPFPYIIGVPGEYFKEAEEIIKNEDVIIVDIDKGSIEVMKKKKEIIKLPTTIRTILTSDSEWCLNQLIEKKLTKRIFNEYIQLCFVKGISLLMKGYEEHLGIMKITENDNVCLFEDEFIRERSIDEHNFLKEMIKTQNVVYYIENTLKNVVNICNEFIDKNLYLLPIKQIIQKYGKNEQNLFQPLLLEPKDEKLFEKSIVEWKINSNIINNIITKKMKSSEEQNNDKQIQWKGDIHKIHIIKENITIKGYSYISSFIQRHNHAKNNEFKLDEFKNWVDKKNDRTQFLLTFNKRKKELNKIRETINLRETELNEILTILNYSSLKSETEQDDESISCIIMLCEGMSYGNGCNDLLQKIIKRDIMYQFKVWNRVAKKMINNSKKDISGYNGLFTLNQIRSDKEKYQEFSDKEYDKTISTIHSLVKMMLSIKTPKNIINKLCENCYAVLYLTESQRKEVNTLVSNITEIY
ncbi:hypothetical protein ENUP19_0378G0048 [Entamoeba nuttalli]|uniref:DENN (AEX-3) domain containing protein n=2 Tax=Entamoeba nuttalli TaxID=412467 RepID=K2H6S1_ENTNP|nr:DENN (AEX-3) domain containing protein [Entamoeba nuttalli P19]EKE38174.1 DENN (AEX-3) domain containing protein [Entamoeba nuttalli P19]|eukprot:XP_008859484.1 DENN (AEX-3) domain containing protein [Entamoeba nuttalli P19]